jgi:acetyl-CoA synthetase
MEDSVPNGYKSYEEFRKHYRTSDRWAFFDGDQTRFNIAHECVDRHPKEKPAINIVFDDGRCETHTFGTLSRRTSQFAHAMARLGIKQGDRIALAMNPSLEFYVSLHGILKMGAVVVACSPLFGTEALEFRLSKSNAKILIIGENGREMIKPGLVDRVISAEELIGLIEKEDENYEPHTSLDTLAFLQFSSGTTGLPKAVEYRHRSVGVVAFRMKFVAGIRDNDRYFCPSSPAWGHGIWYGSVGPLVFGKAIGAYSGKFSAEMLLHGLEEFEITSMYATPLIYRRIMETGRLTDYHLKLRRLTYTGGALSIDIIRYFQDKLGLIIQTNYGSTETGGFLADYDFDDWVAKPGSLGKPLPGVTVGILDEQGQELRPGQVGQIAVRFKKDEPWRKMGDSGYEDDDGYFWYKSRIDDVIISAGYTIGPLEIESVLLKHPAVREAVVVGSPDPKRGEIVKAFIVTDSKKDDRLKEDIREFIKTRLSKHEYPREIEFIDELPTTPDGKVKRKELKMREYQRVNSEDGKYLAKS